MKFDNSKNIVAKKSRIHGWGIYAKKPIKKGKKVIEYIGNKLTKKQSNAVADEQFERGKNKNIDEGHVYIFELNRWYDIDGNVPYNKARLINHSCDPNCEVDVIKDRIWITAIKDIKKGEEISYNYGYDFDCYEDHTCRCGTKKCVGYIMNEDDWPKLKRSLAMKKSWKKRKKTAR